MAIDPDDARAIRLGLRALVRVAHGASVAGGWWHDLATGAPLVRNRAEMIALMHSELSEALEGERKGGNDKHLAERSNVEVELADAIIRIADYAGGFGYDVAGATVEKIEYNATRQDHSRAARLAAGGKKI